MISKEAGKKILDEMHRASSILDTDVRFTLSSGYDKYRRFYLHMKQYINSLTAEDELTVHEWEHMSEEDKQAWCESQPDRFPIPAEDECPERMIGSCSVFAKPRQAKDIKGGTKPLTAEDENQITKQLIEEYCKDQFVGGDPVSIPVDHIKDWLDRREE